MTKSQEIRWHNLKTWPEYWQAVYDGRKRFEVRRNDRGFEIGDGLCLQEWDPATGAHTGRELFRIVRYILPSGHGVEAGCIVMGLS